MRRKYPQFFSGCSSLVGALALALLIVASGSIRTTYSMHFIGSRNSTYVEDLKSPKPYNFQCITGKEPNFTLDLLPIGLQVNSWPLHQLLTRIFALFLRDVLNFRNIHIFPVDFNGSPDDQKYEEKKLSHTMDLLSKRYNNISMINVGVWMPSMGHALKPINVQQAGISTHPGRFGWFAFPNLNISSEYEPHYKVFLDRSHPLYDQFIVDDDQLKLMTQESGYEYYRSPLCTNVTCATLLAEYKTDTSFVKHQIVEMKIFMNVLWLGPHFRVQLHRIYAHYMDSKSNKRFLVLHWTPSDVISNRHNFESIQMPMCDAIRSLWVSNCKYELTPVMKYYTYSLSNDDRLISALRLFWISGYTMKQLFNQLEDRRSNLTDITDDTYNHLACDWLRNHSEEYAGWVKEERTTISIAGIFPIKQNKRGHQNLVQAVRRAVKAINDNKTVLSKYNFHVHENDGECKADIVMKSFLHYITPREILGIVGPACSETVEPIAGISRHINMAVISYSAEGASFLDRQAYPYFFRTIGSNRQYEDVFISLMKAINWKRVAALTEDGQKYTEYISHMESEMKNNNLELIISKKFLSDVNPWQMNKYLLDLKKRNAKIIIADIQDKYACMALCEAHKLGMTAYEGYVWFLPSWISKNCSVLSGDASSGCSSEELKRAFEGHFSITHAPFGNNGTLMEENITIKEWIDAYSSSVDSMSMYTAFAYDAVWVYALAADKLLRETVDNTGNLQSDDAYNRLIDIIWETDFEGLSGRVRFGQGGSRITNLLVTQWRNNQSFRVGQYKPHIVGTGRNMRTDGGKLLLNKTAIVWLSDEKPPGDGTYDCSFATLAQFLNTDCQNATIAFTAVVCLVAVVVVSLVSFLFWKRRFNRKMRRSAKIMKNFGIDLLSPSRSNVNTLDKWEIPKENVVVNRRLGEGAFGTVYGGEAQIGSEGWTAVAVKTLKTGASTEDRLDFLSEAEAMKRFDHKNIVKLLGVCLQSEPIYTIMEFMLYGDLKTYLLARRHMVNDKVSDESDISSKRLTMYALDVARGLSYLAQQKYVHRDIACRNCLVNAQRVVKLGDFGMSRPTYESDYYRFNRKGMLPVRWMAPESLALGVFTPASDVWAFGVVLFEVITFGSFPYQGLTNNQVLEYVKSGNTLQIPIGIKPHLEGLIKACWNRDNKIRPTASEIVEYISKYPTLLAPCLDFPSASVEMAETESDELELLPKTRKCSPLKNDSGLDIVAQTSLADTIDKFNNITSEGTCSLEQINIEMANYQLERESPEPCDASPITPEGYSVMFPLLSYSRKMDNTDASRSKLLKKPSNAMQ